MGHCFLGFPWFLSFSHLLVTVFLLCTHPRSGILLAGTAFLVFPTCSSSYNLQTFSVMDIFLTSLQCTLVVCLWLSFISTWFFPKSPTMQKSLYFGWNAFGVWSLTSMLLPIFSFLGSLGVLPFLFLSLLFLASFRLCTITWYSFVISPMLIMPLSVPRYFGFSDSNKVCFTVTSCLNMRKNGTIPEDSVEKKLYAAIAFHTRSSHSIQVSSCFTIVALRNL